MKPSPPVARPPLGVSNGQDDSAFIFTSIGQNVGEASQRNAADPRQIGPRWPCLRVIADVTRPFTHRCAKLRAQPTALSLIPERCLCELFFCLWVELDPQRLPTYLGEFLRHVGIDFIEV